MRGNLKLFNDLLDKHDGDIMRTVDYLMAEDTVKNMNAMARAEGFTVNGDYLVTMTLPRSTMYFGPKLGAFFANLMGSNGHLTMDLWWSRTFNRYRGQLTQEATETSIEKFRGALERSGVNTQEMSKEEILQEARKYERQFSKKNYKNEFPKKRSAHFPLPSLFTRTSEI